MALGKLKLVDNLNPINNKASPQYWFLKVQADYSGDTEEYWLVSPWERGRFREQARNNKEDIPDAGRGILTTVGNSVRKVARESTSYWAVQVSGPGGPETWFLTDVNLERVRLRVNRNRDDIEANKESWLADLLD